MPGTHTAVILLSSGRVNWSPKPSSSVQLPMLGSAWAGLSIHIFWLKTPFPFSDTWQPSQLNTFNFSRKKNTEGFGKYIYIIFFLQSHNEFNWEFNSSLQWKFPEDKEGKNTGISPNKAFFFSL